MNVTALVGRLTRDPDLSYTPGGKAVTNITLAVNRPYGDNQADFIQCVIWGKSAENTANYMRKGSMVGITGRIQTRHYEDSNTGKRVYVTEVVADYVQFLSSRQSSQNSGYQAQPNNGGGYGSYNQNPSSGYGQGGGYGLSNGGYNQSNNNNPFGGGTIDIADDDLPF
ncbi:MAG: single-stranded DNA-binding protein [Bacillus sp. (in: firmicutes)]